MRGERNIHLYTVYWQALSLWNLMAIFRGDLFLLSCKEKQVFWSEVMPLCLTQGHPLYVHSSPHCIAN